MSQSRFPSPEGNDEDVPSLPEPARLGDLRTRRAFVTGGTRGIGWHVVLALAGAGAAVTFTGRDRRLLAVREAQLRRLGVEARSVAYDVADEASAVDAVTTAAAGGLDILVNNAGITAHDALEDTTTATFDQVLATNVTAAFVHARAASGAIRRSDQGRIINIGSLWSVLGKPRIHAYAVAKHGLAGLTKTLAAEMGTDGVTVNTVAPGYIVTPMNAARVGDPAFDQRVRDRAAIPRWGRPDEIAAVVHFLAGPTAGYITGALIPVDGGTVNIW